MADIAHYTQLTDNPAAALPTIRSLATEMADASPGSLPNSAIVALARVCEHPIKPYRKQCNVTSRKSTWAPHTNDPHVFCCVCSK